MSSSSEGCKNVKTFTINSSGRARNVSMRGRCRNSLNKRNLTKDPRLCLLWLSYNPIARGTSRDNHNGCRYACDTNSLIAKKKKLWLLQIRDTMGNLQETVHFVGRWVGVLWGAWACWGALIGDPLAGGWVVGNMATGRRGPQKECAFPVERVSHPREF